MTKLTLERKEQVDKSAKIIGNAIMTPPIDKDYWRYRVKVSDRQAIIGFPKFGVIGIGFAVEDADWNTNLPSSCDAEDIYRHIKCNKGDAGISAEDCVAAIRLIQEAVAADRSEN
jgi:hypothetical protein